MNAHGDGRASRTAGIRLPQFRPGHIFWIPQGSTWLTREKSRPFVLATGCQPQGFRTLAYGSTRETERSFGAACIAVPPRLTGVNRNGLWSDTAFFPGILLRREYEELPNHAGSLGDRLEDFRTSLRIALGIGRGSCRRPDAPAGSRRGRIVELEPRVASHLATRFAVLLTQPEYSRARHYHLILPIRSGDGHVAAPRVLRIQPCSWSGIFPYPVHSVLLPIPVVQAVWYVTAVRRETNHVLDEDTLAMVDHELCDYFSLPPEENDG